jgi:hypothetical protein
MWEIFTGKMPFANYSLERLRKTVAVEKIYPVIPNDLPAGIQDALRQCWDPKPQYRPSAGKLIKSMKNCLS